MEDTYYGSAKGQTITRDRAKREVLHHDQDWLEMLFDLGDHPTYSATAVLDWLGY